MDYSKYKIAILLPCYNESQTIAKVISDYQDTFPTADIYVYDNNSSDGTDKIAMKAGAIVRYEFEQGKGNVVRSMFKDIDADVYVMADGDDTNPPEPDMVDMILQGRADMVIGDRLSSTYFTENKRLFHNTGNKLVRALINELFGVHVKDIMTGSRAFSYSFVKTYPILSKGFEIETEMTIHAAAHNIRMVEVPVDYRDRPEGSESKLNTFTDGAKVLKTIARLFKEYKPTAFFNFIAVLFLIISLCFGVPVFHEYFRTGMVARFPTLIFSGFVLMISLFMFVTGIILEVIVKKDLQMFELIWIRTKREKTH